MSANEDDAGSAFSGAAIERLRSIDRAGTTFGFELVEASAGFARVRLKVRSDTLNGHGILHGGIVFALADTALAYAANSRNQLTLTQQASIVFLSPVKAGETLIAEATEEASAGRSGVYAVNVCTLDGRTVAVLHGLARSTGERIVAHEA